jgi:hypothetical protein
MLVGRVWGLVGRVWRLVGRVWGLVGRVSKVHFTWTEGSDWPDKPLDSPDKVQVRRTRFRFPTILASKMAEQGFGMAEQGFVPARQRLEPEQHAFQRRLDTSNRYSPTRRKCWALPYALVLSVHQYNENSAQRVISNLRGTAQTVPAPFPDVPVAVGIP